MSVVIRCPLCMEAMQLTRKYESGARFSCSNCARTFDITMLDGSGNLDNEDSLSGEPNDAEKFPPEDDVLHFCKDTDEGTRCGKQSYEVANIVLMDGVTLRKGGGVRVGGRGRMLVACDACCDQS